MSDVIIKVENLTKTFKLYNHPKDRLKEALSPFRKKYHHEYHALRDISFEIRKGESVGILGKNGAGKSTLLKILTGVLTPTSGKVSVSGKIAALLELGSGFNPELSGMENIYFQGAIMGFTKEEMGKKVSEIVSFADIGEFIDQPVKTYSSGMFARLAFSISINVEPDILIVDEALSVGDMFFQLKCFEKFQELLKNNVTILFVTHSLDSVIKFCNKGMVLENGQLINISDSKTAVNFFKKNSGNRHGSSSSINNDELFPIRGTWKKNYELNPYSQIYGEMIVEIIDFGLFDNQDELITGTLHQGDEVTLRFSVVSREDLPDVIFAYAFKDIKGFEVFGSNSQLESGLLYNVKKNESLIIEIKFDMLLNSGDFFLSLGVVCLNGEQLCVQHRMYDVISINVISEKFGTGLFKPQKEFSVRTLNG